MQKQCAGLFVLVSLLASFNGHRTPLIYSYCFGHWSTQTHIRSKNIKSFIIRNKMYCSSVFQLSTISYHSTNIIKEYQVRDIGFSC